MRAAALFEQGVTPAEIARQVGVSHQIVSDWHAAWRRDGRDGLRGAGREQALGGLRPFLGTYDRPVQTLDRWRDAIQLTVTEEAVVKAVLWEVPLQELAERAADHHHCVPSTAWHQ